MSALLPAALLALFALWSGTLPGAASAAGAAAGQVALLAAAAASVRAAGSDPLRLGRRARWLPPLLLVLTMASWADSPVRRAGTVALVLLPALVMLPAGTARAWRSEAAQRRGLQAVSATALIVSLWSLTDRFAGGAPRAAMPLGHHNLLAGWLLSMLPLAVVPLFWPGRQRWLGAVSGASAGAAILASGSLLGTAGLAGQAAVVAGWWWRASARRRSVWFGWSLAVLGLLAVALQAPRLARLAAGGDPSAAARRVYLEAGLRGIAARPLLGWGPGSVPWTAGAVLRPRPGVSPPGEVVADLHSLPLDLAWELGMPGLAIAAAIAVAFGRRRWREAPAGDAGMPARAGLLGLLGGAMFALGNDLLAVPALPVAVAVAAGAALGSSGSPARSGPPGSRRCLLARMVAPAYVLAAAAVLAPLAAAHCSYDRARKADCGSAAERQLEQAVARDPGFPLYRARLAWLRAAGAEASAAAARLALDAARDAPGSAVVWLAAGRLGAAAGEGWAAQALARACWLDPLGAIAPFSLVEAGSSEAAVAARALAAEPRLAAAVLWEGRPGELRRAVELATRRRGLDPDWRQSLAEGTGGGSAPAGALVELVLAMDEEPALSPSLYAFRRSAWPAVLARVTLRAERAAAVDLPPATALPGTDPASLFTLGCGPPPAALEGLPRFEPDRSTAAVENPVRNRLRAPRNLASDRGSLRAAQRSGQTG